jgi:3-phenylpropionate/trans-cinnamate dioxygenase ferredoxin reductase component
MHDSVTIVGASLAGLRGAETLRNDGYDGRITVIGDETATPYDRPPLSKQLLSGKWEVDRTVLYRAERLAELDLDLQLGVRATGLDLRDRALELDGGRRMPFDALLVATGSSPRLLPNTPSLDGLYTLRTLEDSLAIRREFESGPRVVVVGAGFIGAEVAATARERGLEVTMIEALPVPLGRVLGEEMGALCGAIHRDHGVDLRLGVGVDGFDGHERVERVRLSDGSAVEADVVIVGVGVAPNTAWLDGSGLTIDNGVVCDATCLAAPGVSAAGDVARWPNHRFDEVARVEHWDHAIDMGAHAARRLLQSDAEATAFTPVPFFWSDQYDRKIQLAGRPRPDDEVHIATGTVEERRFAALYGRAGKLVAVLGINRPRHVAQYRQLIVDGASLDDALALSRES